MRPCRGWVGGRVGGWVAPGDGNRVAAEGASCRGKASPLSPFPSSPDPLPFSSNRGSSCARTASPDADMTPPFTVLLVASTSRGSAEFEPSQFWTPATSQYTPASSPSSPSLLGWDAASLHETTMPPY